MRLLLSRERLKKQIRLKKEKSTDVLAYPCDLESTLNKQGEVWAFWFGGLVLFKQINHFYPPDLFSRENCNVWKILDMCFQKKKKKKITGIQTNSLNIFLWKTKAQFMWKLLGKLDHEAKDPASFLRIWILWRCFYIHTMGQQPLFLLREGPGTVTAVGNRHDTVTSEVRLGARAKEHLANAAKYCSIG